jgi:XTP/dITP diphosphohydrolase
MSQLFTVAYVTSSTFKKIEATAFAQSGTLADGVAIREVCAFDFRAHEVKEVLEINLETLVQAEVLVAYSQIKVPCIVEHAGLVFEDHLAASYPGGLTKPMWKALGDKFVSETSAGGRRAIARAVVAYCDGTRVVTFVGETRGTIASVPRGRREFYWDTVFIPDSTDPLIAGKTYAEIADDPNLGVEYKMVRLSQSAKALKLFIEHRRRVGAPPLWA